jgi:exopolysaccharide biosynthesis predicted pyruvyltransferase EpsI
VNHSDGRSAILAAIGTDPVVFLRGGGNVGDSLIFEGTRQLLAGARIPFTEIDFHGGRAMTADTILVTGSGGWCMAHHAMPALIGDLEQRCRRLIILPSSFDPEVPGVMAFLMRTKATVFCRERRSYELIEGICDAHLAHDCAFYFDFRPYRGIAPMHGILNAFRTDRETAGRPLPENNEDVSFTTPLLEQWLIRIADHELIRTDRAHVMIAAAMTGRELEYRAGNYHKVPGIAEYSLRNYPVRMMDV